MADIMLGAGPRNEREGDSESPAAVFREEGLVSIVGKRLESAFYVSIVGCVVCCLCVHSGEGIGKEFA